MNRRYCPSDRTQRGFSLAEILVATAIFAIIMVAALLIYDRSQQVFKTSMEAADTQQNARVGFDKLVQDIRMAGYDYDRDGIPTGRANQTWSPETEYKLGQTVNPLVPNGLSYRVQTAGESGTAEPVWPTTEGDIVNDGTVVWVTMEGANQYQQPDEQIEYAGPTAIALRGNFDFESDSANENGRETDLESGQFPVVTTGNDEIVAYGLEPMDGTADTMTLFADTSIPRDAYPGGGAEETLEIPNVELDPTFPNPPYRLMRYTWDDDGDLVSQPLAENIRSLRFEYYLDPVGKTPLRNLAEEDVLDGAGIEGLGAYDPDDPLAIVEGRVVRSRVRSIRVLLVGMSSEPTPEYVDPYEDNTLDNYDEIKEYKKYRLESLVSPRNTGRRGMREQDVTEPGVPTLNKLCFGHCGIAYLEWTAPTVGPGQGAVEQFAILYDTDLVGGFANMVQVGQLTSGYVYGLNPTSTYYFKIQAINSYGANVSVDTLSGSPKNATQPMPPSTLTQDVDASVGKIVLNWPRPTANVSGVDALSCSDGDAPVQTIPPQEIKTYRVYRGLTASFDPATPGASVLLSGTPTFNAATNTVTFDDTTAAACVNYYYRVQTADYCEDNASLNESGITGLSDFYPAVGDDAVLGRHDTASQPVAPSELTISNTYTCSGAPSLCDVPLTWPKVTLNVDGGTIAVDKYIVRRQKTKNDIDVGSPEDFVVTDQSQTTGDSVTFINEDVEKTDPADGQPYVYKYTVVATNCDVEGDPSPERLWPCEFKGGDMSVAVPTAFDGNGLSASSPFLAEFPTDVTVTAANPIRKVTVVVYDEGGTEVDQYVKDGMLFTDFTFTLSGTTNGEMYRLEISAEDEVGCTDTMTRYIMDSSGSNCLVPFAFDSSVIQQTAGQTFMRVKLINQCDDPITITQLKLNWIRTRLASSTGATRLDAINYPLPLGPDPLVAQDRNDATGTVTISTFPVGALLVVPPQSNTYTLKIFFERSVTGTSPISDFCVTYVRDAVSTNFMIIDDGTVAMTCP